MLPIRRQDKKHLGLAVAHKHAPKHEKATAERLGGRVTPGSGSKWTKGDVRVEGILRAELKCTSKKSFSVTREMLHKVEAAAAGTGEIPAMEIQFLNPDGSVAQTYALVPSEVLDRLVRLPKQ